MEMRCDRVRDEAVAERYLTDRLSDDERDRFEAHFFECQSCFEELRTLQALQAELRRNPEHSVWRRAIVRWGAVAALVVATGTVAWLVTRRQPAPPVQVPAATDATAGATQSTPVATVADLAVVEPPDYIPLRVRASAASAVRQFDQGMVHYARREYVQAARLLDAAERDGYPSAAAPFYLGIARLMSGETTGAIDALGRAAADQAFAEDARFFLAKAHLRAGRLAPARGELARVIRIGGARAAAARALSVELDRREASR